MRSSTILRGSQFIQTPCTKLQSQNRPAARNQRKGCRPGGLQTRATAVNMPAMGVKGVKRPPLPALSSVQAVLFDIDGTLTDSDPLHFIAFKEILLELDFNDGVPITEEFFSTKISGRYNPDICRDLFPHYTAEQGVQFSLDKEARFCKLAASMLDPLPGLLDFLAWIDKSGIKKAAVTNAPRANMDIMLASLGLRDSFEVIVIGEECTRPKPYPDPYLEAAQKLGMSPSDVIIAFEDSPSGATSAVAACFPCIGVLTGHSAETLTQVGVSHTIRDYRDLVTMMQ